MLQELSIRQFAIIDDIRITFEDGLTILSGETGAGKSIIISAVNLLLGSRASEKMIRTGADSAEVEALFRVEPGSHVAQAMESHGFSLSEGLLIRRIVSRSDRHRVYINDRLSTMQVLRSLTQHMASISGQHAHQGLLREDQQLLILDQIGGLLPLRKKVYEAFCRLLPSIRQYHKLIKSKDRQKEQLELLRFQRQEIQAAHITVGEDTELEQEIARLKNAQVLMDTVHGSIESLYSASGAVVERIMEVGKRLAQASRIDRALDPPSKALSESAYGIEDVVASLRAYMGTIRMDPGRLEAAEERMDLLVRLKRKYGQTLGDILDKNTAIEQSLAQVENLSDEISKSRKTLLALQAQTGALCQKLSEKRQAAARRLSGEAEGELATLRMNQTRFEVSLVPVISKSKPDPFLVFENRLMTETGFETARFLIAPNVGEALKPLSDIASGGELSRIVLALKAILAQADAVETIIFDEVDAGIGGTVADVVGSKLANLSRFHQVICITHLPQIARFGAHQFKIDKQVAGKRTTTTIHKLSQEERIDEIARMMAGERVTPKTLAHASEMMAGAQRKKHHE
jgi:DNA repair protein RecN (Recombination protein N)